MIHLVKEKLHISDDLLIPDAEDLHYLVKVRRIRNREKVSFASEGDVFETECLLSGKEAIFKITNKYSQLQNKPKLFAALASADISALEECLRNGVEAGADAFFIFRSDYSNTDMKLIEKKMPRLKTIVASAASQSRRTMLPDIILKKMEELAEMNCEHIALHPYSPINLNSYDCKTKKTKCFGSVPKGGFQKKKTSFSRIKISECFLSRHRSYEWKTP